MGFLLLLLSVCLLSCSGTTSAQTGATVRVNVGSDAVLPCFIRPERDITRDVFDWKKDGQTDVFFHDNNVRNTQGDNFKGRVFNFPDQLQSGNASIVIRDTTLSDSGNYTCDFPRLGQMFYIELVVDCILRDRSEENIPGACPKPHITTLEQTRYWAILKCEVQGFKVSPKPTVQWQDSAGNNLTAEETLVPMTGGTNDTILKTKVTETDKYQCVVTQKDICHQISEKTHVYIHDSSAGLAADVVVTFVVTLVGLLAKGCITQN